MNEESKKFVVQNESHAEAIKILRDEMSGEINRLRTGYDEKILELEKRLEVALGKNQHLKFTLTSTKFSGSCLKKETMGKTSIYGRSDKLQLMLSFGQFLMANALLIAKYPVNFYRKLTLHGTLM